MSGDVNIAYQVVDGDGPDLLYVSGWVSHLDMMWDDPLQRPWIERLAAMGRLILFDKRGVGLSDRVSIDRLPSLEERMDDVRTVLDAAGSTEAYILGHSEGSVMSVLYAATHPDRTIGLILYGAYAARRSTDDYPWAPSSEARGAFLESVLTDWPFPIGWQTMAPSEEGNEHFKQTFARYLRSAASPAAAHALGVMNTEADVRDVLSIVTTPTLLIHRTEDQDALVEGARYMAERMPNARLVELSGSDHLPWLGESEQVLAEIEEFVTGNRSAIKPDRVLATVLFTDIVDSTARAGEVGDAEWRKLLDWHDTVSRQAIEKYRGRAIKGTGDGYLATFDGPARAIRAALEIGATAVDLGIEVRAGIHAGEIELRGDDIGGIAVHIASRVAGHAGPGEVLVSRTVKDLVAGSGLSFADRGEQVLKGIDEKWQLFAAMEPAG
jgi:pimeloyl-ACP methyl ester carboxylesterase